MYKYIYNGQYHSDTSIGYLTALGADTDAIEAIIADEVRYQQQQDSLAEAEASRQKLIGIEFDGVMCSATKEDMWGLSAVDRLIQAGDTVNFSFSNGNNLALTLDNIDAFNAIWWPFRVSFF